MFSIWFFSPGCKNQIVNRNRRYRKGDSSMLTFDDFTLVVLKLVVTLLINLVLRFIKRKLKRQKEVRRFKRRSRKRCGA